MKKLIFSFLLLPISLWANGLILNFHSVQGAPYYDFYDHNSQQVGHIASYELSSLGIVIVHSLYVLPACRGKGYAQQMLSLLLSDYQRQGYSVAYIQIGPYERGQYLDEKSEEYTGRVLKLKKLYTKLGFESAPWYEQCVAGVLYPFLGIHAASEYLLKKDLSFQSEAGFNQYSQLPIAASTFKS